MMKTQKLFAVLVIASTMTTAGLQSCNTAETQLSSEGTEAVAMENTESDEEHASSNINEGETSLTNEGSGNIDQMLDDYEAYVTEYIEFSKKAMEGDAVAMAKYPALMEKANDLEKSLQKAEKDDNLSMEQLDRMTKIQAKMLEGISEMTSRAAKTIGG